MRFPSRAGWLAGVGLAQFGEFGFVLIRLAQMKGVIDADAASPILAAGIASMFLTPLLVRAAPHIRAGERLLAPLERRIGVRSTAELAASPELTGHIVIVGYGLAGQFVSRVLAACGVPFIVFELNADNVRKGRQADHPVYYGDATSEEVLGHARLAKARMLVLLMNDPQAATRVVDTARRVASEVPVMIRTHYLLERPKLIAIGATEVVVEEVETAIEVIALLLRRLEIPRNVIDESIESVRAETHVSDRTQTVPRTMLRDLRGLEEMKIDSVLVHERSGAVGQSPVTLRLQTRTGALVVGVRRGDHLLESVDPALPFQAGDVVFLTGTAAAIRAAVELFEVGVRSEEQGART